MSQRHHFISYSNADSPEFAIRLHDSLEGGYPKIAAWLDKRDLKPGGDWDTQIAEGIRDCDSLLFVMTPDSVVDTSMCKQEWSLALKYKKPVVPLLLKKCDAPFRLQNRQHIDFSTDFESGIAKLRDHVRWLASPEGELQRLKDQLADAERDLRRASDGDTARRIQDEIAALKQTITRQQEIVNNPAAAAQRTEQSIERGLQRERQPEKPVSGVHHSKFINPPPGIAPDYFQDRFIETRMVVDFLHNDAQRLITIVGRGGIGKTAMVCRLLKSLENGKLPDDDTHPVSPSLRAERGQGGEVANPAASSSDPGGEDFIPPRHAMERGSGGEDFIPPRPEGEGQGVRVLPLDGIIYLSETGSRRATLANLFSDLGNFLPKETAAELDAVYKNPQASPESKTRRLLEAFPTGRIILLLDNFEDTLDDNRHIRDAELDEALKTILNAPPHAVKIIITTRITPPRPPADSSRTPAYACARTRYGLRLALCRKCPAPDGH